MEARDKCKFNFKKLSDKDIKSFRILELIRRKGSISRTEISRTTGINIVSVSNYMKRYIDEGLVGEKGFADSTGGRKQELMELNRSNSVIGIEAGAKNVRAVLADIGLNVIKKSAKPVNNSEVEKVRAASVALVRELLNGGVKAIGVGASLPESVSIAKDIESAAGIKTFSANEASCAAFGEKELNKNSQPGELLYIHTDIGRGIVFMEDGRRMTEDESRYLAPWQERLGIIMLAKMDVARGVGTSIVEFAKGKMEDISVQAVIDAARGKDEVALSIMRSVGMGLGLRIAYLINLFAPKTVIIGGGIEKAGDLVLGPIQKTVKRLSLKNFSITVAVLPAVLGEDAVSLGAASLAVREIFLNA